MILVAADISRVQQLSVGIRYRRIIIDIKTRVPLPSII
jgi:hypothetical protein